MEEKEEYRKQIIETIEKLKREDILIYVLNIVRDICCEDF